MNIETLFSTKERIKILRSVIFKTEELSVNKVAKDLALSKGLISRYFDSLVKECILKKINSKCIVQDNLKTKTIKIMLNLSFFDQKIFRKFKFVKSAGIYGSYVKGTNTEDSDIDLWILIGKTNEENLAKLTNTLKKVFGTVKPLYLTEEKIKLLRKEDMTFYHSLIFGSVLVYGDGIEKI